MSKSIPAGTRGKLFGQIKDRVFNVEVTVVQPGRDVIGVVPIDPKYTTPKNGAMMYFKWIGRRWMHVTKEHSSFGFSTTNNRVWLKLT